MKILKTPTRWPVVITHEDLGLYECDARSFRTLLKRPYTNCLVFMKTHGTTLLHMNKTDVSRLIGSNSRVVFEIRDVTEHTKRVRNWGVPWNAPNGYTTEPYSQVKLVLWGSGVLAPSPETIVDLKNGNIHDIYQDLDRFQRLSTLLSEQQVADAHLAA